MIRYILSAIRFRSPIYIDRPGPLARWRLWRERRGRCHNCGRRVNGLMPGIDERRRSWSSREDGRVFYCRNCWPGTSAQRGA